ncbi:MAG: hypothetical protein K0Q72_423 [Armatimonadetes bacterium]|jgi:hypothetical protein|nr:hypothetical protein [Armatimonadota bacterium]
MRDLLLIHAVATWFLTGVVWFVQVVHYPLLADAEWNGAAVHRRIVLRTTCLVVPAMALEGITGVLLLLHSDGAANRTLLVLGLLLAVVNWIATATVQVPAHRRLIASWNGKDAAGLVRSNRLRTMVWSARSLLVFWLLTGAPGSGGR